jgi:membrane-bound lytic murein transglycosylase B
MYYLNETLKPLLLALFLAFLPLQLTANDDRPPIPYDFLAKKNVQHFIDTMVHTYHFKRSYMRSVMKSARLDRDTLARYTGRYKAGSTVGTWKRFKAHVLDPETLQKAKRFKRKYHKILTKASREYHVPPEYIVGFLTVESKLGTYTGDYRTLDALSTLAFHKNRMQKFFRNELKHFFLMCREQGYDPRKVKSSFAGAVGCVQQVPSIFRRYGMDYNGDGKKDPWSIEDCVGVIARFMHKNGWKMGRQVAVRARYKGTRFTKLKTGFKTRYTLATLKKYGVVPVSRFTESKASLLKLHDSCCDELWLGAKNFRVLTRYNPSSNYGMAIVKIAQAIR